MSLISKVTTVLFTALIFTLTTGNSVAMDSSTHPIQFKNANRGPVVSLFSAVDGVIVNSGKAATGIKVERRYNFGWVDKDFSEFTVTDSQGRYSFKEATKWMFLGSLLPHEPVIPQKIVIYPEPEQEGVEIWSHIKRNYNTMGELNGLQPYIEQVATERLTPVMQGFIQGKLRLEVDLAVIKQLVTDEVEFQAVDSNTSVISASDLQLPYQQAVNQVKQFLANSKNQVQAALHTYLTSNASIFDALKEERLQAYGDLTYIDVESLDLYENVELIDFVSDASKSSDGKTIELGGEIIMQMKNSAGEPVRIRVWLSYARFRMDQQQVRFLGGHNSFTFNEFNIDANGEA